MYFGSSFFNSFSTFRDLPHLIPLTFIKLDAIYCLWHYRCCTMSMVMLGGLESCVCFNLEKLYDNFLNVAMSNCAFVI